MYYYTKEWYLKSKGTGLYLSLSRCTAEEAGSREYFEKIFAIYTDDVRFECEQIKNSTYEMFAEDRTESEELLKQEFIRWHEEHDPEDAEFIATARLSEKIEYLKMILPKEIISEIPDIRIFALGKADERITELVTEYSEECRSFVMEVDSRFEDEYSARTEDIPDEIWTEYGFKGGSINKIIRNGTDMTFYINNCGSGSDVTAMHLKDCAVEKLDEGLEGAEWIYNEMYFENGVYELHGICRSKNNFPEFIIHTKDIAFDYDR
ncbi:MAG: DUF4085 family protein [Oscillospiraceae bacterium]|nr:DUF4085 family protein [Oscillospiraceae bacterium]